MIVLGANIYMFVFVFTKFITEFIIEIAEIVLPDPTLWKTKVFLITGLE